MDARDSLLVLLGLVARRSSLVTRCSLLGLVARCSFARCCCPLSLARRSEEVGGLYDTILYLLTRFKREEVDALEKREPVNRRPSTVNR